MGRAILERRDFPFMAVYVSRDDRFGGEHRQPVKILEAFGQRFKCEAVRKTWVPGMRRPYLAGEQFPLVKWHVEPE